LVKSTVYAERYFIGLTNIGGKMAGEWVLGMYKKYLWGEGLV
jgi:hypothetical protein